MEKLCWKRKAFKALSFGKGAKRTAGRNFSGSITIFHRGGGAKRLLRRIDFERKNVARGVVERIEYDPNRTARIALIRWSIFQLNSWKQHHNYKNTSSSDSLSFKESSSRLQRPFSRMEQNILRIQQQSLNRASPGSSNLNIKKQTTGISFNQKIGSIKKAPPMFVYNENLISSFNIIQGPHTVRLPNRSEGQGPQRGYLPEATTAQEKNFVKSRKHFSNSILTNSISKPKNKNSVQTAFSYIIACNDLKPGDEVFNLNNQTTEKSHFGELNNEFQSNFSAVYPAEELYEKKGISLPLWLAPLGCSIHNIEIYPGQGGKLARAAGACAQLVQKPLKESYSQLSSFQLSNSSNSSISPLVFENPLRGSAEAEVVPQEPTLKTRTAAFTGQGPGRLGGRLELPMDAQGPQKSSPTNDNDKSTGKNGHLVGIQTKDPFMCTIRLPSGQQLLLDLRCRATIGIVSNIDHNRRNLKKAGQRRWMGFRPVVRGVAMNPIDHPHGGGEGRTKGGRPSVSPWGKPAKGAKRRIPLAKRRARTKK